MNSSSNTAPGNAVALPADAFRLLVHSVRDYAIFMLDPTGRILTWNLGAQQLKGYAPEEIIGSHFSRFYPPEALARKLPEYELVVAAEVGRFEDEGWRVRKDGTMFWANVIITALRDEQGRLIGYGKVTRDLSDRRKQEEALRFSELRFRTLVDGVRDYAIFMLDDSGRVATWNKGAQQIKGYEAHEIIGSHFSRFYPPEAIARGLPDIELRGATLDGRFEDEGWRVRKDGSRFWASVVLTAMRDASGALIGFSKITRDLTERRRHENKLRESEERFRLLVEGVADYAIVMLDRSGLVTSWNSGATAITGYEAAEIVGKHFCHLFSVEDVESNKPWRHVALAQREGRAVEEGWRKRKDGALFWANTVLTALTGDEARPLGFAYVVQDLTHRRHAESLADAAQRMHEFIAMLAHELRNPLAPIRNAVELMARKGLADPALESMRKVIDRQSTYLMRLLDELLDVSRIARGEFVVRKEQVELGDVLNRALETSRPLIETRKHRLYIDETPSVRLRGDLIRLTQVFVNLLNNAAKYTPEGGEIRVSSTVRGADVEIRITDNGSGIDADKLEAIFDLFTQLSPESQANLQHGGLGVGLALVRRIVELHGGRVFARSAGAGRGSQFVLHLPVSTQQRSVAAPAADSAEPATRSLRAVIVDDNKDAADSLHLLIQSMGHNVRTVYDGREAARLIETFKPDVVLLDIGMPHMSGLDIARQLRENGSTAVLVAVTGWGQPADRARAKAAGFDHHLLKPVSESTLRQVLRFAATRA